MIGVHWNLFKSAKKPVALHY